MYGFPMVDGVAGPKVASEQDTVESDPDRIDRAVAESDARAIFEDHARGRLRGVTPRVLRTATCLYTSSPTRRFWSGAIPSPTRSPSSRRARGTASSIRRRSAKRSPRSSSAARPWCRSTPSPRRAERRPRHRDAGPCRPARPPRPRFPYSQGFDFPIRSFR
jgi:hypothetical protein